MHISPINTKYNHNNNISYKSNFRDIKNAKGKMLYRTDTAFLRDGLSWNWFVDFLAKKYKDVDKVHLIDHACSSGQETYSIASMLISRLGEKNAQKFFPIIARDINKINIEKAKNIPVGGELYEMQKLNSYFRYDFNNFFKVVEPIEDTDDFALVPKDILKEKIDFKQSNIFDDIDVIPPQNTILFCRNFWPYLSPSKRDLLLEKMLTRFIDDSSLIIIGNYDVNTCQLDIQMLRKGFERVMGDTIFTVPTK